MYITKLTKVAALGTYDETYGQSYWCETESESLPVKFNSLSRDFAVGQVISAEEKAMKKSLKGTDYWQYKKVKRLDDASSAVTAATAPEGLVVHQPPPFHVPQAPYEAPETTLLLQSILALTTQVNAKLDRLLGAESDLDPPLSQIDRE